LIDTGGVVGERQLPVVVAVRKRRDELVDRKVSAPQPTPAELRTGRACRRL